MKITSFIAPLELFLKKLRIAKKLGCGKKKEEIQVQRIGTSGREPPLLTHGTDHYPGTLKENSQIAQKLMGILINIA